MERSLKEQRLNINKSQMTKIIAVQPNTNKPTVDQYQPQESI